MNKVNPHYKMLVGAMRRRAEDLAKRYEGEIEEFFCDFYGTNASYAVLLLRPIGGGELPGEPVHLLYGDSTTDPSFRDEARGDVGITITSIPIPPPWLKETSIIDILIEFTDRASRRITTCRDCGHAVLVREDGDYMLCPACGREDHQDVEDCEDDDD